MEMCGNGNLELLDMSLLPSFYASLRLNYF